MCRWRFLCLDSGLGAEGLGFGVQGLGSTLDGSGFRVKGGYRAPFRARVVVRAHPHLPGGCAGSAFPDF